MIKNTRFLIVCLLLILASLYINLHSDVEVPLNRPFKEFPMEHKGWHMVSESQFSDEILNVLKTTDYMLRKYIGSDKMPVYLYVGYHDGGKDSGEIHSPKNCLPGSGWFKLTEDKMNIDDIKLIKAIYQKGKDKELFLYWFNVRGKTLTNEFVLKYAEIKNSMLYRRKDASFIRVSVPFESDENKAFSIGKKFIKDFNPIIEEFLPD